MNPLQTHILANRLDEVDLMNSLQDHGLVSDLCVDASDVAPQDARTALQWLGSREDEKSANTL